MIAVVQRVSRARVTVAAAGGDAASREETGAIDEGLLVLVGAAQGDGAAEADLLARKVAEMRIFADDAGRMNRSVIEVGGGVLVVPQFTLLADLEKGRRPGFASALAPDAARELVERFAGALERQGLRVARGRFGRAMEVELVNQGPATFLLDTRIWSRPKA